MNKKAPGVFVPTRYVEQVGLLPAHLLAQIVFWFGKASGGKSHWIVKGFGHLWLAHSRAALGQETGLTGSQIKGALTQLKRLKIIEVEQHLFEEKNISHIRLHRNCPDWVGENLPAGLPLQRLLEVAESANSSSSETKEKNKRDFAAPSAPIVLGKKKKKKETKEGVKIIAPPALEASSSSTVQKLKAVYRTGFKDTYPEDFLPDFTGREFGQLKQVANWCLEDDPEAVLDFAVRNWHEVLASARRGQGAFNMPEKPYLGFIVSMFQSVVHAHRQACQNATRLKNKWPDNHCKQPKKAGQLVDVISFVKEPEDKMITLEELEEMLGYND
ncbi:MAG: hypothetical protein U1B30_06835 [Pseudomonadota bacterium]|nr:hypothetical protein [Pseudomonadota bacterium]